MTTYSNLNNLPVPIAVWLITDDYDYQTDPNYISATTVIKPTKQVILGSRVDSSKLIIDSESLVAPSFGTAIHDSIERAWTTKDIGSLLTKLGYAEGTKVKINPLATDVLDSQTIPVYIEQRSKRELDGFTIGGKFDFVFNGSLHDFKTTSVYTYINDSHANDYILQGSIYRWLNPSIIKGDFLRICYIFTDWSKASSLSNPSYPKSRIAYKDYPLMSLESTEQYLKARILAIKTFRDKQEEEIPECTDEELWRAPTVYKYFSNPDATKATKNFDSLYEANTYMAKMGKGIVKTVPGTVRRCQYCAAATVCKQKDRYL